MDPFHEEIDRRRAQFEWWLRRMQDRRRGIVEGDCFIVFSDDNSSSSAQPHLKRTKSKTLAWTRAFGSTFDVSDYRTDHDREDEPESDGNSADSGRFVQFAFCDRHFFMDEPDSTLFPTEATRLLQERTGFYFARERISSFPADSYEAAFNPVLKQYVNGDELSAAEDMAYLFFASSAEFVGEFWFGEAAEVVK